ncbi:MAG: WYL domain-containing protein, partial [Solirubrobacteraceae bacterium]
RGRRRTVPGGDPAAFVARQLRGAGGDGGGDAHAADAVAGRLRLLAPAARVRARVPDRYATVEPDGDGACIVTTRGAWSRGFLVWMALLDEPLQVLEPPALVDAARALAARLTVAA